VSRFYRQWHLFVFRRFIIIIFLLDMLSYRYYIAGLFLPPPLPLSYHNIGVVIIITSSGFRVAKVLGCVTLLLYYCMDSIEMSVWFPYGDFGVIIITQGFSLFLIAGS